MPPEEDIRLTEDMRMTEGKQTIQSEYTSVRNESSLNV